LDWYKVFAFDGKEFYLEVRIMYSTEIFINGQLELNYLNDCGKENFDKSLQLGKVDIVERVSKLLLILSLNFFGKIYLC